MNSQQSSVLRKAIDQVINDEAHEHHKRMKIKKQQSMKQEDHSNSLSMVEWIMAAPRRSWIRRGCAGQTRGNEAAQVGDMEALGDGDHGDMLG